MQTQAPELYSAREIALAAGVAEERVVAALGGRRYVEHADAVRVGRQLAVTEPAAMDASDAPPLFSTVGRGSIRREAAVPFAVSSSVHLVAAAIAAFVASMNLAPHAALLAADERPADPMRLVFLATPGPGGGGGGGGLVQKAPPPKAMREGRQSISSPVPLRREPKPVEQVPKPPEPKPQPPLKAETLPAVVAPIITAPADTKNRVGVLEQTTADTDGHGAGRGGGAGSGTGTGLGAGDGSGVGPGSGGGTGGGPYRPGSGITPPRVLKEVTADYTEEARQRGITGEVVLEIVVRRDGTVGDARILRGLAAGLNERAVEAVRQWRFAPAQRLGTPVDVIVEVAVEFRLR